MSINGDSAILIVDQGETNQSMVNTNAQDELQFHMYVPTTKSQTNSNQVISPTVLKNNKVFFNEDDDEEEDVLLGSEKVPKPAPAIWQLEYFARYFDVTSSQVLARILWSLMPLTGL